jgi:predicted permease
VGPLEQGIDIFVVAQWPAPPRRGPFFYTTLARLRPGIDRSTAAEELRAINRRIFPLWRSSFQDERATWSMIDLKEHVVGEVGTASTVAVSAVLLVWLIACVNASNLLIARVTSRKRELAVRAALGASRGRVVRLLLAESALLATGAVVAGAALAWWGIAFLRQAGAPFVPRSQEIVWDASVLATLAVLAAMSTLLFGLIPAVHGTAFTQRHSLRAEAPSSSGSLAVERLRRLLIGGQFAVATPLIILAALLAISLQKLGQVDLGFDGRHMVSGSVALPPVKYAEPAATATFWSELRLRVAALPGVTAVAFADGRPPQGVGNFNNFDLEEFPTPPGQSQPVAPWVAVTPEYFRVLGLKLVDGRTLEEADARRPELETVVVDEAWVRRFFPGRTAVGKRFREGGCTNCPWTAVVGVVTNVKYAGLNRPNEGTVYTPMGEGARTRFVILRTGGDPKAVLPDVRRVLRDLDPAVPLSGVATINELVEQTLTAPRSLTLLVGALASVAVILSVLGLHGLMAFHIQQRSKDISIRLALGGTGRDIVRLILGQALKVVSAGVLVGVAGAILLTQWISSLLFGVDPADPATIAGVTAGPARHGDDRMPASREARPGAAASAGAACGVTNAGPSPDGRTAVSRGCEAPTAPPGALLANAS